eukprot:scaffold2639_cov385-Prasinococcus_capsulatus_cf.AAC.12
MRPKGPVSSSPMRDHEPRLACAYTQSQPRLGFWACRAWCNSCRPPDSLTLGGLQLESADCDLGRAVSWRKKRMRRLKRKRRKMRQRSK